MSDSRSKAEVAQHYPDADLSVVTHVDPDPTRIQQLPVRVANEDADEHCRQEVQLQSIVGGREVQGSHKKNLNFILLLFKIQFLPCYLDIQYVVIYKMAHRQPYKSRI